MMLSFCDAANEFVENAQCIDDIYPLLKKIPLSLIKNCMQSRIADLKDRIMPSDNPQKDPQYASECDEITSITWACTSITDILPKDIMIHIVSFVTKNRKFRQFLPTLSKTFNSIMNDQYFYHNCTLTLYDLPIPNANSENANDRSVLHISRSYRARIHIRHKPMHQRCAKSIASKLSQTQIPWQNPTELIIAGAAERYNLTDIAHNANVLEVLQQVNHVKSLSFYHFIVSERLQSYPVFSNVVKLALSNYCSSDFIFDDVGITTWLTAQRFPSLRHLQTHIPNNATSNDINAWLESLELSVLHLTQTQNKSNDDQLRLQIPSHQNYLKRKYLGKIQRS